MNNVSLVGNLCTDTRTRKTQSGKDITTFKVAVDRPGKDAGADFIWVKAWNGTAKACDQYLSKGAPVAILGEIRTSQVRNEAGEVEREYVEVNARSVKFLSRRSDDQPEAVEASTAPPEDDSFVPTDDDIPF